MEDEIESAGARIIWVLEAGVGNAPGTAEECESFMSQSGSSRGLCVGDEQTQPEPGTFDDSPFSRGRGFDIVVPRRTMVIERTTNHGTPGGNDNIDGEGVLALVQEVLAEG